MDNANFENNNQVKSENIEKTDQQIKKRPIQKQNENEQNQENNNEQEGEEEEESEYEYEYVASTGLYVIVSIVLIAFIGFIIFINLNYPMSKHVKEMFIGSLIDFENQFFMKKVYIAAICIFVIFQVVNSISLIISRYLKADTGNSNNKDLNELAGSSVIGAFIIAGIIFPIVEELIFRKLVFGVISHFSIILAYIVSSFVFAFYHFEFSIEKLKEEIYRFPVYLFAGIMFAYVYDYTDCILATMLGHILNNSYTVILSLMGILN